MDSSNDALKPVLSQLVQKVELKFGDGLWGKRRIRVVTGCDAYLFTNFSFTTVSRGDRIRTCDLLVPKRQAFDL